MSTTKLPSTLAWAALALALSFVVTAPARACWDGYHARVGDVEVAGGDMDWDPDTIAERARWLGRVDALLPDGATVFSYFGGVSVMVDGTSTDFSWDDGHYLTLFREVARVVHASPETIAAARALETPVYVVQTASFLDEARARAHADALSQRDDVGHGFIEVGGFPAENPVAHVVSIASARVVHRVYVGAFVDRAQAEALAADVGGMVRVL